MFFAILIWWNFQELLYGKNDNDSLGSSFITISKKVTDENMGKPNLTTFSSKEIVALSHAPQVQDIGVLTANRFPAFIRLNSVYGFSTDIFLEAVPDRFIDTKPPTWFWDSTTRQVPLILSGEFLNLYNYGFALSRGMPQFSQSTIQSLAFDLVLGSSEIKETYGAHVAGFSDRITSVLVPQSFMDYANAKFGNAASAAPSRLIVKIADPSDKAFVAFLQEKNYVTNAENLRWNKLRSVVEVVVSATGVLALLLMGISVLVFILFVELTIAQAQQSLSLLSLMGYAPSFLRKLMQRKFLPIMLLAVLLALCIAVGAQYYIASAAKAYQLHLSSLPGLHLWGVALVCLVLLYWQVQRGIAKAIQ